MHPTMVLVGWYFRRGMKKHFNFYFLIITSLVHKICNTFVAKNSNSKNAYAKKNPQLIGQVLLPLLIVLLSNEKYDP